MKMRTLKEIIESAKSGVIPTHQECYWALLATEHLRRLTTHLLNYGVSDLVLIMKEGAMSTCPKQWLGVNCPEIKEAEMFETESKEKRRILKLYNDRLDDKASSEQLAGMGSWENQCLRFEAFLEMGISDGNSVLDVGCGQGDFLKFCNERENPIAVQYKGIDIVPGLIKKACLKFPEGNFVLGDVLDIPIFPHDFIIANGTFNFHYEHMDNVEVVKTFLSKCFPLAKKALAVSLMSTHVDYRKEILHYYDPSEMFRFAKSLTRRVTLRHDLPMYDFILYLYQE